MMIRLLTSLLLLFAVISLVIIGAQTEATMREQPGRPAMQVHDRVTLGNFLMTDQPKLVVIRSQAEMDRIGIPLGNHAINFDTQSVVLVTLGAKSSTGYGVSIEHVNRIGGVVHVIVKTSSPRAGQMVGWAITYPQIAAIVDKIAATEKVVLDLPAGQIDATPMAAPNNADRR